MKNTLTTLHTILNALLLHSLLATVSFGEVTVHRWFKIGGSNLSSLTENPRYPGAPDERLQMESLSTSKLSDSYGQRLQAYVLPEINGNYVFRIAGNDACQLSLSTDADRSNAQVIASFRGWTNPDQWNKYSSQTSDAIALESGQEYYIEVLHKEHNGHDFVDVQWGIAAPATGEVENFEDIPEDRLKAYDDEPDFAVDYNSPGVLLERWLNVGSSRLSGLTGHARFPAEPHQRTIIPTFTTEVDFADNYGQRLQALLTAPVDSAYVFRIAGDDDCELSLSTNASMLGKTRIAYIKGYTSPGQWNRYSTQTSEPIALELGREYFIEALHKEGGGGDHLAVEWAIYDEATGETGQFAPIDTDILRPYPGEDWDLDHDNLVDTWEQEYGFDPNAPQAGDYAASADPDGDKITNEKESHLGSDPFAFTTQAGHYSHYSWKGTHHYGVEDIRDIDEYFLPAQTYAQTPVEEARDFPGYSSHKLRATLTPETSGKHRFWISAKTSAELWLSEDDTPFRKKFLCGLSPETGSGHGIPYTTQNLWDKFTSQMSQEVELEAGKSYYLEILVQHGHSGGSHASLAWSPPGENRQLIPNSAIASVAPREDDLDNDCLLDSWEEAYGLDTSDNGLHDRLRQGEGGDFDQDGLSNLEEYILGTDPSSADSDKDGLTDTDEARVYWTSPTVSDAPSEEVVLEMDLTQNESPGKPWAYTQLGLLSSSFRGEVSLPFESPSDGFFILSIATGLLGDLHLQEAVPVEVLIDGNSLGLSTLAFGTSKEFVLRILSPYLSEGSHKITLRIHNILGRRTVTIKSIKLLEPDGADLDQDGAPDWITSQLRDLNNISVEGLGQSITSPAFLEGKTREVQSTRLNGYPVEAGADPDTWYANLELSEDAPTVYEVQFADGIQQEGMITWTPLNLFENNGVTFTIREGDSLLLAGYPTFGFTGDFVMLTQTEMANWDNVEGTLGSEPSSDTEAERLSLGTDFNYVPRRFETAGSYSIHAEHANGDRATIHIIVKKASFDSTITDLLAGSQATLLLPTKDVDSGLYFDGGAEVKADNPAPVVNGKIELTIAPEGSGTGRILARLHDGGPVLDAKALHTIQVSDALQNNITESRGDFNFPEHYVVTTPIVSLGLPEGGRIKVTIFRSGVTFLDGQKVRDLYAEDFTNGVHHLKFLFPAGMGGGYCHHLDIYDRNGKHLARR